MTQYELLHTSYQAACDALEAAGPNTAQVMVRLSENAMGFDADLLAEEVRVLLFEAAAGENPDNGFRHLAQKLYRRGWDDTAFSRLCRACVHVMAQEFPLQTTLSEKVYTVSEDIPRPADAQTGQASAVLLLQHMRPLFLEGMAAYSPVIQYTIRRVQEGVLSGEGVSIKLIAADGGVTPAYLGHLFKKETGSFFSDYLLHCRLERSIVLMHHPSRKVKDIAETVVFSSTSYFVKCFREYKGVSPAKYRTVWGDSARGGTL